MDYGFVWPKCHTFQLSQPIFTGANARQNHNNRHTVCGGGGGGGGGPSQWAFDGDWRWTLTGLCVPSLCLLCRIIHTTMVYPLSLYSTFFGYYFFNGLMCTLQVLHIFWAALIVRMVIKFLPGNVGAVVVLFFSFPNRLRGIYPPPTNHDSRVFFFCCRTSWRTRGATGRRRSRTRTKALTASRRKKQQTVTCATDTLLSTTTTVNETEWTGGTAGSANALDPAVLRAKE